MAEASEEKEEAEAGSAQASPRSQAASGAEGSQAGDAAAETMVPDDAGDGEAAGDGANTEAPRARFALTGFEGENPQDLVSLDDLVQFIFPSDLQHPLSTGRLRARRAETRGTRRRRGRDAHHSRSRRRRGRDANVSDRGGAAAAAWIGDADLSEETGARAPQVRVWLLRSAR